MKIRTATIADLPVITEIYRQTRTEARHAAADCQVWFDTHAQSDRYGVWVAVVHGAVVGYGAIDPYETAFAASAGAPLLRWPRAPPPLSVDAPAPAAAAGVFPGRHPAALGQGLVR